MDNKTFKDILKLNHDFYESVAESFDKTREKPWKGWDRIIAYINTQFGHSATSTTAFKKVQIVDLGCGNGRLADYLLKNALFNFNYIGYDISHKLLSFAKNKYKQENIKFLEHNVITDFDGINFDSVASVTIVCAFGITHHIPDEKFRLKWFENISKKINKQGMFIYSNWNFGKADKNDNTLGLLEKNDKIYGWQNTNNKRYVHVYDEEETHAINRVLEQDFKLVDTFCEDGKSGVLNSYWVWGKE